MVCGGNESDEGSKVKWRREGRGGLVDPKYFDFAARRSGRWRKAVKEIAEPLFQTLANSNLNSSIVLTEAHQIGEGSSEGEKKGRSHKLRKNQKKKKTDENDR